MKLTSSLNLILISFLFLVFTFVGCNKSQKKIKNQKNDSTSVSDTLNKKIQNIVGDTLSISPDKSSALIKVNTDSSAELWITYNQNAHKIFNFQEGEGIHNLAWSPNKDFVAMETYNTQGHSPLTTAHVWITGKDGKYVKEILLPKPNERFDTFLQKWISNDSLIVSSATLEESGQKYLFVISENILQKYNKEN